VDPELRALLTEEIAVGSEQQAFPLLTVDDAGFPYVSLISRAELRVRNDGALLIAVRGNNTRANLKRDGRAGLIAIGGDTAHYLTLKLLGNSDQGRFEGFVLEVLGHRRDSLGIALSPVGYTVTPELAARESWVYVSALLDSLW
jgi:Pyridoxamine 5'-phosphate oxidase